MDDILSNPIFIGALSLAGAAALITSLVRMRQFFQADIPKRIDSNTEKIDDLDKRLAFIENTYEGRSSSFNTSIAALQKSIDEGHRRSAEAHREMKEALAELRKEFAEVAKENKQHEADRRKDIYSRLDRLEGR